MPDGFVQALWRFPVLGMRGEQLRSSQVDTRGIAGDRQHFAMGPEGRLSAHDLPGLTQWSAAFPFNPDGAIGPRPPAAVSGRDRARRAAAWRWGDPRLGHAMRRDLGREVMLMRDINAARGVTIAAVEPEQGRAAAGINVQLAVDWPPVGGWAGRELIFRAGVRLRLVASRGDGPGIEARVVEAGRLLLGEPVKLG